MTSDTTESPVWNHPPLSGGTFLEELHPMAAWESSSLYGRNLRTFWINSPRLGIILPRKEEPL